MNCLISSTPELSHHLCSFAPAPKKLKAPFELKIKRGFSSVYDKFYGTLRDRRCLTGMTAEPSLPSPRRTVRSACNCFASLLTFALGVIVTAFFIDPQLPPLVLPDASASNVSATAKENSLQRYRIEPERLNLRQTAILSCMRPSKAIYKPIPKYPTAAKDACVSGLINVQVTIDETGSVINARALNGDERLRRAAVEAAQETLFEPVSLADQYVKVVGVIRYNFVLD